MALNRISRRYFFYGSLLAGSLPAAGFGSVASLSRLGYKSPNEKLNIAAIGVGGKGYSDVIESCQGENLVAMTDPDEARAAQAFTRFPQVPRYRDFRRMFDHEAKNVDAVTVSTPDHMHGTISMWAMSRGIHVYCQKPLARTVWEVRQLTLAAARYKVATQMGNHGYSSDDERTCCEMLWSGVIGDVVEVHGWTNRPGTWWPQGPAVVPAEQPVPPTLDWDTWLGVAASRSFSPAYAPFNWRAFPDFGCGALGDMGCHVLATANMALRLTAPTSVECVRQSGRGNYTFPQRAEIRFDFPGRGAMPPVRVYWHDNMEAQPEIAGVPKGEILGNKDINGSLFIGTKGMITTGIHGQSTRLVPAAKMAGYHYPDKVLTRSPGHYRDWKRACKGGDPACSNFSVAGPFAEWVLLGNIALRVEGRLDWDAQTMRFTNSREANRYLRPTFRKGWQFV
jgi:predicted dehydrogenase